MLNVTFLGLSNKSLNFKHTVCYLFLENIWKEECENLLLIQFNSSEHTATERNKTAVARCCH